MSSLTQEKKTAICRARRGAVVTAAGGRASAPTATVDDEHLLVAPTANSAAVEDLWHVPQAEVRVADPVRGSAFRFCGVAQLFTSGKHYDGGLELLRNSGHDVGDDRAVVVMRLESAEHLEPDLGRQSPGADGNGYAADADPSPPREGDRVELLEATFWREAGHIGKVISVIGATAAVCFSQADEEGSTHVEFVSLADLRGAAEETASGDGEH